MTFKRWFALLATFGLGSAAHADQLRYLPHGEDALTAIYQSITDAKKTIDLTYFIYEPCHTSTRVITDLLLEKAKSGIKVRVLLDSFLHTNEIHEQIALEMQSAGIEFRSYNKTYKYSLMANHRSHVKLLLVDGREYITGGRNIGDDYFSLSSGVNFIDRDVWVRGASASQARAGFEMLWKSSLSSKVRITNVGKKSWSSLCSEKSKVSAKEKMKLRSFVRSKAQKTLAKLPVRECAKVQFIIDDPRFMSVLTSEPRNETGYTPYMNSDRLRHKAATREFVRFLNRTTSRLEVENWSYIPTEDMRTAFQNLRAKKIKVEVVTNGSAAAGGFIDPGFDHILAQSSAADNQGSQVVLQMPRSGLMTDRHALTPKSAEFKLHGKVAIRDRNTSLVGSFNIDPRSYHTNLESFVIVDNCSAFATDIRAPITGLKHTYIEAQKNPNTINSQSPAQIHRVLGWLMYNFL
ncbi:MAG: hypothetical protein KF789_13220 [Bdellovibrionaceae bacterium]|nr:hypothetical protein [Pseudobdellovibrionaceae bacterium]